MGITRMALMGMVGFFRPHTSFIYSIGLLAGSLGVVHAQESALIQRLEAARQNASLKEQLVTQGRKAAAVCAYCHGEGGNSVKPDVPNLAAQNAAYLVEQIQKFSDGRRRNEFMEGLVKALKTDEKVGVALYFAEQKVNPPQATSSQLAAKGKSYYERLCFRCHGTDGHGNEKIARIAGQQTSYLIFTLKRYRNGTGERLDPLMSSNTKLMSDADIDAVAAYVTTMP
jgi:cytochrome c553